MSEPKVTVETEPVEEVATVCEDCGEPLPPRCVRHEALHLLKTKGRKWLMERAMEWMEEGDKKVTR